MKTCKSCEKEKELEQFHNHPATTDKKAPICKECANEVSRKRYRELKADPEKYRIEREKANNQKKEKVQRLKNLRRNERM